MQFSEYGIVDRNYKTVIWRAYNRTGGAVILDKFDCNSKIKGNIAHRSKGKTGVAPFDRW